MRRGEDSRAIMMGVWQSITSEAMSLGSIRRRSTGWTSPRSTLPRKSAFLSSFRLKCTGRNFALKPSL